jgi:putative Mn2+ efflux pump MntP
MDFLTIIIIAVGLSMDSFAVSIANGISIKDLNIKKSILIASSLAIFQGGMPLLGWLCGIGVEEYIREIDHWTAFILLSIIGSKMLYEAITDSEEEKIKTLKLSSLIAQSIATSIDAFAVGISFAFLNSPISFPVIMITLVTFLFSIIGLKIGKTMGSKLGKSVEFFGGLVLIAIGIKILIEHLYFQ